MLRSDETEAFERFDAALSYGFPVRVKDAIDAGRWTVEQAERLARSYARGGRAEPATVARQFWLVPLNPRVGLDEFIAMTTPALVQALTFARSARIFPLQDLQDEVSRAEGIGAGDPRAVRLANRLRQLDLVEERSTKGTRSKLLAVTAKGLRLLSEAEAYRVPSFARAGEGKDLSKFHKVIDL
jgi:hypothetical protein